MSDQAIATGAGSTDFVKKLFQMLEHTDYHDIVRWTSTDDSFVVLDTNEFTREILPKHFKHSNFASFVRQLNKYDFHKVKALGEERLKQEHGDDAWEFKHPDFRRNDRDALENIKRKGPVPKKGHGDGLEAVSGLEADVRSLMETQTSLVAELKMLHTKYQTVVDNVASLTIANEHHQRSFTALVSYLNGAGIKISPVDLQEAVYAPSLVAASHMQSLLVPPTNFHPQHLRVLSGVEGSSMPMEAPHKFHVLLVEDDNVCIQLCRKFLFKYGCTVEVVTDGLSAVSVVEKVKYDLVLMDIVMPNLDGATATSIIRSFDQATPIIAMTGNIEDADLVTYLQHGMSDILAKPFTSTDLYMMLEKHLIKPSNTTGSKAPLQGPPQQSLPMSGGTMPHSHNGLPHMVQDPPSKKQRRG